MEGNQMWWLGASPPVFGLDMLEELQVFSLHWSRINKSHVKADDMFQKMTSCEKETGARQKDRQMKSITEA